jgi:hypothetical protein
MSKESTKREPISTPAISELGIIGIILGTLVLITLFCSMLVYLFIVIYGGGLDYISI